MRTELDVNVFIMQNGSTSINIQKYVLLKNRYLLIIIIIIIIILIIIIIIIVVVVVVYVVVNLWPRYMIFIKTRARL